MESTALVARIGRPDDAPVPLPSPAAASTPFGRMVAALESRHSGESATSHFGAVRWSGFPVRRLLADAAALVVDAVGKRSGQPAETLAQAQKIAKQTDAKLNLGILLLHGSPEAAAIAFDRDVIGTTRAEAALLHAADVPSTLANVWVVPAYKFLVACVKRGRQEAEQLRASIGRLEHRNVTAIAGYPIHSDLRTESQILSSVEDGSETLSKSECARILGLPAFLAAHEAVIETGVCVLKPETPLRGHELLGVDSSLLDTWIRTAVLKVANGDPSAARGPLSPETAEAAHTLLVNLDPDAVVEPIIAIVRARTRRLAPNWRDAGEAYARTVAAEHVQWLRQSKAGPSVIDHFIDLYLSSGALVELNHHQALQYLEPRDSDDDAELPSALRESIERAIDWTQLDFQTVEAILDGRKLPVASIIARLGELSENVRKEIVRTLLRDRPSLINDLLDGGHLAWKASFGTKYADDLSPVFIARSIRERLAGDALSENDLIESIPLMLRIPPEALRDIWADPTLRRPLGTIVELILFEGCRTVDVSAATEAQLARNAGEPFEAIVLECYANERYAIYGDTDDRPEDEEPLPRWERTAAEGKTVWTFVEAVRRTLGARLPALIAENSEDDCYARHVADRPNSQELLAAFRASRDRFYANQ